MTFGAEFQVESYLRHQGASFVQRFDANTYLYLTRCMDLFDPLAEGSPLRAGLGAVDAEFLIVSFDTDWRFPTAHSAAIAQALEAGGVPVERHEVASPWGHDSFLMDVPEYLEIVREFLAPSAILPRDPPRRHDARVRPRDEVRRILLRYRRLAVVGLSPDTSRPSYRAMVHMRAAGYDDHPGQPDLPGGAGPPLRADPRRARRGGPARDRRHLPARRGDPAGGGRGDRAGRQGDLDAARPGRGGVGRSGPATPASR